MVPCDVGELMTSWGEEEAVTAEGTSQGELGVMG